MLRALRAIRQHLFNPYALYVDRLSSTGRLPAAFPLAEFVRCSENHTLLVTVAFNHPELVAKQMERARLHVRDEAYVHLVADNSPSRAMRERIAVLCRKWEAYYVPIPRLHHTLISTRLFGDGLSHGVALNWVYRHLVRYCRPSLIALLDHDLFPTKDYSFAARLADAPFYGVDRDRKAGWYLWPGFCCFRTDVLRGIRPNFLPCVVGGVYLDAGGANYIPLFSRYRRDGLRFAESKTYRIRETPGLTGWNDIYHADCVQRIDGAWLHIVNGSNYARLAGKEETVASILARY